MGGERADGQAGRERACTARLSTHSAARPRRAGMQGGVLPPAGTWVVAHLCLVSVVWLLAKASAGSSAAGSSAAGSSAAGSSAGAPHRGLHSGAIASDIAPGVCSGPSEATGGKKSSCRRK